ncbi:MAG: peroxide stress protein YaaA, partial [Acidobacteria bacterium]
MIFTILSPAKKLDFSRSLPCVETTQPALMDDATVLMSIVRDLNLDQIAQLMGVSEKLAALTHARFEALDLPFSVGNAQAAALIFDGEAYRGLDAGSLTIPDLEWAQDHVGILSGLFGLLRPLD